MHINSVQPRGLPRLLAPVDSFEGRDRIQVQLDMPGIKKEDILLQFDDELNLLTVDALRQPPALPDMAVRTQERQMGRIGRWIALTKPVDANRIRASLENGVLMITLPKKKV
jgi:HSP20 family protein